MVDIEHVEDHLFEVRTAHKVGESQEVDRKGKDEEDSDQEEVGVEPEVAVRNVAETGYDVEGSHRCQNSEQIGLER